MAVHLHRRDEAERYVMQVSHRQPTTERRRRVSAKACPRCQGKLVREHRRLLDRLYSLVRPLKRYRCGNLACQWEGNIARARVHPSAPGIAADASEPGDLPRQRSRAPGRFAMHLALVAVGVAFVFAFTVTGPRVRNPDVESGVVPQVHEPTGKLAFTAKEPR